MPVGHTSYRELAAKAPQPTTTPPPCNHREVDWAYVVEDRGPASILEGRCVQCGDTVQGDQEHPNGEILKVRRVH